MKCDESVAEMSTINILMNVQSFRIAFGKSRLRVFQQSAPELCAHQIKDAQLERHDKNRTTMIQL